MTIVWTDYLIYRAQTRGDEDEDEAGSVELSPDITAELNAQGELIGIEILRASIFMRDAVLESFQDRIARVTAIEPA